VMPTQNASIFPMDTSANVTQLRVTMVMVRNVTDQLTNALTVPILASSVTTVSKLVPTLTPGSSVPVQRVGLEMAESVGHH